MEKANFDLISCGKFYVTQLKEKHWVDATIRVRGIPELTDIGEDEEVPYLYLFREPKGINIVKQRLRKNCSRNLYYGEFPFSLKKSGFSIRLDNLYDIINLEYVLFTGSEASLEFTEEPSESKKIEIQIIMKSSFDFLNLFPKNRNLKFSIEKKQKRITVNYKVNEIPISVVIFEP